ncbi:GNAT family N-acetyltransferase [Sphingomicrobium sp. XHP0239]|uniref:GNAT family N-acetyltransferase n=1 Tax=Sphingomicrobium maritimum TaxID=3133972 RepID=UPI0031CCA2B4
MGAHPAPRLSTERLILRGFVAEDFDAIYAYHQHPEVYRFFGPEPIGREELWRRTLASVGGWTVNGIGGWMVERRDEGDVIGTVAIFDSLRGKGWDGEAELGYIFAAPMHGQGYAGEACRAALMWFDAERGGDLYAMIDPRNASSHRLAERLGFAAERRFDYQGEELVLLKRPAPSD